MVESQPSKLLVAGSIPASRSSLRPRAAASLLRQAVRDGWCEAVPAGWSEGGPLSHPGPLDGAKTESATGDVWLATDD